MHITNWRPNHGPIVDGQIFAIGDIHGQAGTLEILLDHISSIPDKGKRRDILFLGDLIDRGPENLRAINLAMGARTLCDRLFIMPGNHELMMLRALSFGNQHPNIFLHWFQNGGYALVDEIEPESGALSPDFLERLGKRIPADFLQMISTGPTYRLDQGLMFIHAGLLPDADPEDFLGTQRLVAPHHHHWAWIREDFLIHQQGWCHYGAGLVVHGHTPWTNSLITDPGEYPDIASEYGRINLDVGASTVPQIAAVEFIDDKHRIHVAQGPCPDDT